MQWINTYYNYISIYCKYLNIIPKLAEARQNSKIAMVTNNFIIFPSSNYLCNVRNDVFLITSRLISLCNSKLPPRITITRYYNYDYTVHTVLRSTLLQK